jgi:hypothetical protein
MGILFEYKRRLSARSIDYDNHHGGTGHEQSEHVGTRK